MPGDVYTIPRTCIESEVKPEELSLWLGGSYDLFLQMKRIFSLNRSI
jgi:hypothetical protein